MTAVDGGGGGVLACWRNTPRRVLLAHAAMAFASVTFGGLNVIAKRALSDGSRSLNPYMFGLYRDVLACPLLLAWTSHRRGWRRVASRRDLALLLLCGLTGIFGNQLLYLIGLSMTSSDTAAIYQPVAPMLTGVLAVWPVAVPRNT